MDNNEIVKMEISVANCVFCGQHHPLLEIYKLRVPIYDCENDHFVTFEGRCPITGDVLMLAIPHPR